MSTSWMELYSHAVRISKKIFFFYKASHSVPFPADPVRLTLRFRNPLARMLTGWLPLFLKKPFLHIRIHERIIEYPYTLKNLDLPLGSTILDLGSTGTPFALQLANLGYKVLAVDLRPYPYKHPNLTLWHGNFLQNDLPSESVDGALTISTIEHFGIPFYGGPWQENADLDAMAELWRLLKPSGLLIATLPYGKAAVTNLLRVYDSARLNRLLEKFAVEEILYYTRKQGSQWFPATETDMHEIDCRALTEGVALIRARKPA